jgi:thioredoxin reductase
VYDAVVVGGGPAGLSAAGWLGRYRRRVVLLDGGEQRNRWVDRSHGYLTHDHADPKELLRVARAQIEAYPTVELRSSRARAARRDDDGTFVVEVAAGLLPVRRVVLATGVVDAFPEVEGFFEHYGADVFHCPTCDGYEAQGREVVAFGWSSEIAGFALTLLEWAATVTVVTDGSRFEGDETCRRALERHSVDLLEDDAVELLGRRGDLHGVRLQGGSVLPCQLAFFSIAHQPRTELAVQLGCRLTGEGCIEVDHEGRTSTPGVYAAGDVTPGMQLVQVAAAKGTVAGVSCAMSLQGEPAASGAPAPGPDVEAELS